eukprot:scaffold115998_cov14-Tisochrysis_lutea.AAC.1
MPILSQVPLVPAAPTAPALTNLHLLFTAVTATAQQPALPGSALQVQACARILHAHTQTDRQGALLALQLLLLGCAARGALVARLQLSAVGFLLLRLQPTTSQETPHPSIT